MKNLQSDQNLSIIKDTIKSFFPDGKVILFGSRARGESNNDSDYDLLIVTPNEIEVKNKRQLRTKIHLSLLNKDIISDILLNSENEISQKKEIPGHIISWAVKEGIFL